MTNSFAFDPAALERLHALIGEALALSDLHQLHATGIALDTARLSVEDALLDVRGERISPERRWLQGGSTPAGRG